MTFQLPEHYLRKDLLWGPPEEEITIDGRPFELYFKSDALQAVEWMRNFQDDNREEDEDEKYENRGNIKDTEFKEVRDEERLNALRSERARQDKLAGISRKPKNAAAQANQRNNNNKNRGKRNNQYKRRHITEIKSAVRLEPNFLVKFLQSDLARKSAPLPSVEDLGMFGKPYIYNVQQDSATAAAPVPLSDAKINLSNLDKCARATTLEDTTVRKFLAGHTGQHPCVVMTDEVMAMLMASAASVYPWHLQVKKMPNLPVYFITKDGDSMAEMLWVSETTPPDVRPSEADPMPSERISSLGKESTLVHERFLRASCTNRLGDVSVSKGFPFPGTHTRMYRYRRFTMHADSPSRYDIIVRTEIDAVTPNNEFLRLFGLLEHRPQTGVNASVTDALKLQSDWEANLDSNKGVYVPVEFRKNQFKMARWIALSAISGAKRVKIGFITRDKNEKEDPSRRHRLLHVHTNTPGTLASQLGVTLPSMWGTLDMLLEAMMSADDLSNAVFAKIAGEYAVVLGQIQVDSNEDDDDDEEDDDDDE